MKGVPLSFKLVWLFFQIALFYAKTLAGCTLEGYELGIHFCDFGKAGMAGKKELYYKEVFIVLKVFSGKLGKTNRHKKGAIATPRLQMNNTAPKSR